MGGRVAIVTGGASGIGAGVARKLGSLGVCVAVADVDAAGAARTVDEICFNDYAIEVDVTGEAAVRAAVARVSRRDDGRWRWLGRPPPARPGAGPPGCSSREAQS
ncbi:MAG TPA: SDR family NAD(P)-dependent oxidoreductase [Candidatus Dormibacteraeota bacterium]|nr:SDR family NAD(P)-dependent oxidoreductase [Candidatus Dormibacteraeota bacterium]